MLLTGMTNIIEMKFEMLWEKTIEVSNFDAVQCQNRRAFDKPASLIKTITIERHDIKRYCHSKSQVGVQVEKLCNNTLVIHFFYKHKRKVSPSLSLCYIFLVSDLPMLNTISGTACI